MYKNVVKVVNEF